MEIKNCPFCGKKARIFQIPENTPEELKNHPKWRWKNPGLWIIGCWTERCMGNINHITMVFVNKEQAIETWNRREG